MPLSARRPREESVGVGSHPDRLRRVLIAVGQLHALSDGCSGHPLLQVTLLAARATLVFGEPLESYGRIWGMRREAAYPR
jgi:hypothetical protein